ncbi:MAG: ABC transporter ATP-binding protein [Candidatus Tectomicrobia bacterium]|nr:ABC transporter ATP-binding protein [Candidatus Tectomicrobia bacterium]
MALALIALFLGMILEMIGPYLIKIAIDRYMIGEIENWAERISGIELMAFFYLGTLFLRFITGYIDTYMMTLLAQRVMHDMRMGIFSHLQKLAMRFFDRNPVGRLMTRVTNDVEVLNEMLTGGIIQTIGDLFLMVGLIFWLLYLNWYLALVAFSIIPVMVFITTIYRPRIRLLYRMIREKISEINVNMNENLSGISVVQIFNREDRNFKRFEGINQEYLDTNLRAIFLDSLFYPGIQALSTISVSMIIWYGGRFVVQDVIPLGTLVAFIYYVQMFFRPIMDIGMQYGVMQRAMASCERIFTLLDEGYEIESPIHPVPLKEVKGEIEFRGVSFAYDEENWVLKNVSFHVKPGEKVAIVGATGAGKTSTIRLLSRFYEFQKGEILIDGVDIRQINLYTLRKNIGVVLQEFHVFTGTIEENIRLGEEGLPFERVKAAAEYVNADKFIEKLPRKYQEEMKERGSTLSTGQKQLLAFARVLVFDPKIIILDEATSNVDTETEILIQDALKKLLEGRTALIIAHRLSTIQHVDRIIVFHKGEIKEVGTHQELLAKGGIYYKLYQLQFKDQEIFVG